MPHLVQPSLQNPYAYITWMRNVIDCVCTSLCVCVCVFVCVCVCVCVCVLGCFKKQLFLRITLGFFILCTNIIKSSQKKIQVIWRSFDPPTRGSFFTKEIDEKYKENPQKIEKSSFLVHFSSIFVLLSISGMAMIDFNTI